ncbi:hypothetical protein DFP72DRAFT_903359 [Ephemerocybe angulata]|uniref:Chromo domain-containing protein n=1 Tax=Ephemerocybe angulata TaxID=980116 RepID=A0A8H6HVF6_9AGAR|nr:hypothetical protein DFP72DRAFT_903359 [Tulosesus angulatus]
MTKPYDPAFKRPPLTICDPDVCPIPPVLTSSGVKEYFINNIIDAQWRDGSVKYLVRWLTRGPDFDTWEPFNHVKHTAAYARWVHYQEIPVDVPVNSIVESLQCTVLLSPSSRRS